MMQKNSPLYLTSASSPQSHPQSRQNVYLSSREASTAANVYALNTQSDLSDPAATPGTAAPLYLQSNPHQSMQAASEPLMFSAPRTVPRGAAVPKPLRVAHVGPCLMHGGAEQHLRSLIRYSDPSKMVIDRCIVTQADHCDRNVAEQLGVNVVVGGRHVLQQAAAQTDVLLFWGLALDQWLTDFRPSLCVYLAHGESHWTGQLLHKSAAVTDHTIAVSQRARIATCGDVPTTEIHNGIDPARLQSRRNRRDVRAALGFKESDFLLGIVARYSPEKRFELLIDTIAQLPRRFKMLAVGCGPGLGSLLQLANEKIPNRYAFVSADTELGDYYGAMDAYCMTSEHEGFGLVVLEAMYCGLPVIGTLVGAVPELVQEGISGYVVAPQATAFRDAALKLATDGKRARSMGQAGRRYALEKGHASQMSERYFRLFETLWQDKFLSA